MLVQMMCSHCMSMENLSPSRSACKAAAQPSELLGHCCTYHNYHCHDVTTAFMVSLQGVCFALSLAGQCCIHHNHNHH